MNCHISIVIAICLWCSQSISHLNKSEVQSSTFPIGKSLIQVAIVSLRVKLVTILLGWFSKVLSCWLTLHWCIWCIRCISQCSTTCAQWSCKLAVFLPVFWKNFRFWKEDLMLVGGVWDCWMKNVHENSLLWRFCSHREQLECETPCYLFLLTILSFGLFVHQQLK